MPPILQALLAFFLALVVIVGPIMILRRKLKTEEKSSSKLPQTQGGAVKTSEQLCQNAQIPLIRGGEKITGYVGNNTYILRNGLKVKLIDANKAKELIRESYADKDERLRAFEKLSVMARLTASVCFKNIQFETNS